MKKLNYTLLLLISLPFFLAAQQTQTQKPVIQGRHWVAITGKPLGATAGSAIFHKGGNAVDAACAMLAATATMWDKLSWGGETQALIYNPNTKKVIGINALGVAPTGATPEFFKEKGRPYPPANGPLAAVTPGTPGGLFTMLAEYGTMSLKEVLAPAMEMAAGYPMEIYNANEIEKNKALIKRWPYSKKIFLTNPRQKREGPHPGEIFVQKDLLSTLKKLVAAEQKAKFAGKDRKAAIYAAYDRFYRGDIAEEFVRGAQEQGGLITMEDLDTWKVHIEEPVMTTYKGIEVYKLTHWVQGPVLLQALNLLENVDLKAMGYNSTEYIHTLYQAMNMAFADRDFYYGDPYFPPEEPIQGLLSKEYAKKRWEAMNAEKNDPNIGPGDPYPFEGEGKKNPYLDMLQNWGKASLSRPRLDDTRFAQEMSDEEAFYIGTTSIQAVDKEGWVVSITPSGGWVPACIAGKTGVGMSQRMQSFVLDEKQNPFNVLAPGKRPRATLTPSLALKDGKPYLSFAVQGGDSQDQNLLQYFLNIVEFGMNAQEAAEAANINSFQMRSSFGKHLSEPGKLLLHDTTTEETRKALMEKGYQLDFAPRTSGPINGIFFDWKNGTFWGSASNYGDDYGIGW